MNIGKNAPSTVQQKPSMARHVGNTVTDQVVLMGFGAATLAELGAVGTAYNANQLGDDSFSDGQSVLY